MKLKDFDFRVWDEDNEEFYKNPSIFKIKQIKGPRNVVLSSYSYNKRINFEGYDRKFEVELFTGLYDKNGKKIYEGDIIKVGFINIPCFNVGNTCDTTQTTSNNELDKMLENLERDLIEDRKKFKMDEFFANAKF